jgi:hypothetical protein
MEKIIISINSIHRRHNLHNLLLWLMMAANLVYLYYILIIAANNSIFLDDYCFMANYKKYGLVKSIGWWYNNWQGRFLPQFITNIFVFTYEKINSLLPYSILLISLFVYTIYRLVTQLTGIKSRFSSQQNLLIFTVSLLFVNALLITNFEFSTFFWLNVSTMYFGGIAFGLLGFSELINESRKSLSYILIFVGFFYAGCSAEHFGAILFLSLGCYVLYLLILGGRKLKITLRLRKSIVALTACSTAFFIMISAPGNAVRRSYFPTPSFMEAIKITWKSFNGIVFDAIPSRIGVLFILFSCFVYAGTRLRTGNKKDDLMVIIKIFLLLLGSFSIIFISILPGTYATSTMVPARALTHVAFLLCVFAAYAGFELGSKTLFPKKIAFAGAIIGASCFLLLGYNRIRVTLKPTIEYAKSERKRMLYLDNLKEKHNVNIAGLDSLKYSYKNVLVYSEIATDTTDKDKYWVNKCICEGKNLSFKILLRKDE